MKNFTRLSNNFLNTTRWLLTLTVCLLVLPAMAAIRRVDAGVSGGNSSGSSWANAISDLQAAINASSAGDELWIKAGTYKPLGVSTITYSFHMRSGVQLYGGFDGGESQRDQRDFKNNVVQLNPYNTISLYPIIDNSSVNSAALLDGVTLISFNLGNQSNGGAMRNTGGSFPTISNVIFLSNTASSFVTGDRGGALYIDGGNSPITNVTFKGNNCSGQGGAVYMANCTSTLTNVVFSNNRAESGGSGGAMYCQESAPKLVNVVFEDNYTGGFGGAVYCTNPNNLNNTPSFTNVVFYKNRSTSSSGGAVCSENSSPSFVNCTFALNQCGSGSGDAGGGVYSFGSSISITNCLFKANTSGTSATALTDIASQNFLNSGSVTSSSYKEATNNGGSATGGNTGPVTAPFVDINNGAGTDGTWMTADDGLRLAYCTAFDVVDKGNSGIPNIPATDIRGGSFNRKVNLDFVPDGAAGFIDMGAYEDQNGSITLISITGSIGTSHTVPFPKEANDTLKNIVSPTISGVSYLWQASIDSGRTWSTAPGPNTSAFYVLPSINRYTEYRRRVISSTVCGTPFYSNVVKINVVNPDGSITGTVLNTSGRPVQGILITVTRKTPISGGPVGHRDTAITAADGTYTVSNIYYGDPDINTSRDTFTVRPSAPGHSFDITSVDKVLTTTNNTTTANFTDQTAITITGRTVQECTGCVGASPQTCPVDSVRILQNGQFLNVYTGLSGGEYGRYNTSVTVQSALVLKAQYTGLRFRPDSIILNPSADVTNADFKDTTTRVISGRLTDGCDVFMGNAVLEFTDVLPPGPNGTVRSSCFRKQVTTTGSGAYSIRLPARKYRVSVVSFTPAFGTGDVRYVSQTDLQSFISKPAIQDSLTRDVSTRDTTLNIRYIRPPFVGITQGLNIICTTPQPFALIRQNKLDSFRVLVYQGDSSLNCPLADTTNKIRIVTNVQREDQTEEILLAVADTGTKVRLKGGIPNITGDRLKDFSVFFTDNYNRTAATFNRKVLVTGVKADAATYTTVSPEVPLVVLHDPPGDASSSTWRQSQSISNAVRFYTAAGVGVEAWAEAKIGAQSTIGLIVATDASVWGTIRGSIGVNATVTPSNEAILTTTTSQNFSTSENSQVTGNSGDVYIGAALNLVYAVATDIGFNNCSITSNRRLIIANSGFNTQYIYSEDFIINTLIPNLQSLAALQPDSAARYLNQVRVWQQVVNNNAENKRRAGFVQNYSFDGSAGPYNNTTTTTASKTSSLQFAVEINASVAAELGFEVAGTGASGGVNVNFRLETGGSNSNTITDETTIGYTLDDNTPGDFFSVNVKKDPVYNTPVFELAAGTASCPTEPGAQPRDAVFFTANNPVVQNVAPTAPANFNLKIVNTSASTSTNPNDKRVYKLNYVQSSNVANETITIAGTPYNSNSPYISRPLAYLDSVIVPVSITRQSGSAVYSYESEKFSVSSSCDEDLGKTVAVSAYFTAPCSGIGMAQPADSWVVAAANSNQIFVKPVDYTVDANTSVELQYATGNSNNWTTSSTLTSTQLANGFNFDVASLSDGPVSIRLRLNCASGTTYSQRSSGIIDRRPPRLYGRPDPTDDNYVNGDAIAFTYDEKLNPNPTGLQVTMRRLSNNTLIPATATVYENKITIVPGSPIASLTGDSIRLVITGVNDVYGNVKPAADTIRFTIGTTVAGTGNRALFVTISNPSVYKNNDTGAIRVIFNLPTAATNDTRVNYTIGGTARYNVDYTATYTGADALYASFNGSTGSIKIPTGATQATLTLRPIFGDTSFSPSKTIIISAVDGGDYLLGTPTAVTGFLTSEDGLTTYTFNGDGNWNIRNNWLNGKMPLTTLVAPKEIIIDPSGTCTLNVAQTIRTGAKVTVKQNRRFVIKGNLKVN